MATISWKVKVVNTNDGLTGYKESSVKSKKMKTYKNGTTLYADKIVNNSDGVWLRNKADKYWMRQQTPSGKIYLKTLETNAKVTSTMGAAQNSNTDKSKYTGTGKSNNTSSKKKGVTGSVASYTNNATKQSKPTSSNGTTVSRGATTDVVQMNANAYPPMSHKDTQGNIWYNWTMATSNLAKSVATVKKNLNIPSAYNRLQLAKLTNTKFNKFKIEYGDYDLKPTIAYVVFTRPDLNIFDENKKVLSQIANDPQLYYIWRNNPIILKQLTLDYAGKHKFIPLLTNQVTALDVLDESMETFETGQTFTGFKMQYAKHSIRSLTAGSISVKFPETANLDITQMFQAWCSYESGVYRGTLIPKSEYCAYKILDYACDIYYFLMDTDMNIKFWSVYYGAFPTNVNKSIFSFDMGSNSGGSDVNITFAYFHKLDCDIRCLVDFNDISGGVTDGITYRPDYNPSIGIGAGGSTWCGAPFVEAIRKKNGLGTVDEFKLRFRT